MTTQEIVNVSIMRIYCEQIMQLHSTKKPCKALKNGNENENVNVHYNCSITLHINSRMKYAIVFNAIAQSQKIN